jgi:hypothetical protein
VVDQLLFCDWQDASRAANWSLRDPRTNSILDTNDGPPSARKEGEAPVDWLQFGVQWLHVLAAITWFGAVIYTDFILIPGLMKLPIDQQRTAGGAVGEQAFRVIVGAATATIILGVLRGTLFGQIRSVDALLGTSYGITWLVALVVAIVTFSWA